MKVAQAEVTEIGSSERVTKMGQEESKAAQ